jgi:hypothetical protein
MVLASAHGRSHERHRGDAIGWRENQMRRHDLA